MNIETVIVKSFETAETAIEVARTQKIDIESELIVNMTYLICAYKDIDPIVDSKQFDRIRKKLLAIIDTTK